MSATKTMLPPCPTCLYRHAPAEATAVVTIQRCMARRVAAGRPVVESWKS